MRIGALCNGFVKVNKRTAYLYYMKGYSVRLAASNMNPTNIYYMFYDLDKNSDSEFVLDETGFYNRFYSLVNSFSYYNCNTETGENVSFWIKEETYNAPKKEMRFICEKVNGRDFDKAFRTAKKAFPHRKYNAFLAGYDSAENPVYTAKFNITERELNHFKKTI